MSIQPTDPPAWASLLEKIQGETGLQKAFGQHYTNDGGYLSVTFNTDKGMTVYLVISSRTLTEADPTLAKPYADLVQPRWSKPALEVYLTNEREPDPPTKFQRLKAALDSMLDFGQHSTDSAIVCCSAHIYTNCLMLTHIWGYWDRKAAARPSWDRSSRKWLSIQSVQPALQLPSYLGRQR